jgi:transcriptional regulator
LYNPETELLDIVRQTVLLYEQNMPRPWSFDADSNFIKRLLAQIVGFRIPIAKIEGKMEAESEPPSRTATEGY